MKSMIAVLTLAAVAILALSLTVYGGSADTLPVGRAQDNEGIAVHNTVGNGVVELSITTFSGRELLEDMLKYLISVMLNGGGNLSDKEADALMMQYLASVDVTGYTRQSGSVTVNLYRGNDNNWMVDADDALLSALSIK